jgi:hypothetical protein
MNCWICGKKAETGEHKIKKSLMVALHGRGPYKGESAVVHVKGDEIRDIQGPNSDRIKYADCLCADCNNRRTQPFDVAFDQFFTFVLANEQEILKYRLIDFSTVFGPSFEIGQRNLFKYFVKLMGCELSHQGCPVPNDLRELLDQDSFRTGLKLSFAVNEDKLLLKNVGDRPTGTGDMNTSERNLGAKDDPKYRWHTYFSFLHTYYWYLVESDGPFGAYWIADSRYLYLGAYHPLTPEQRADVIKRSQEA